MPAKWLGIFAVLSLLLASGIALADADDDNGAMHLTMDQTTTLQLEQDAASVIVNNPDHVSATLDNPRLLILTPHEQGTTSMIVLDSAGKTILQQDLIVTNVQQDYVRIRRACSGGDGACAATSYAYCPDGCYEVTAVPNVAGGGGSVPPPPSAPRGLIEGEPAETLIGPTDDCPEGYNKSAVPGLKGDMHYTCSRR